jgi:hypothetical protein
VTLAEEYGCRVHVNLAVALLWLVRACNIIKLKLLETMQICRCSDLNLSFRAI